MGYSIFDFLESPQTHTISRSSMEAKKNIPFNFRCRCGELSVRPTPSTVYRDNIQISRHQKMKARFMWVLSPTERTPPSKQLGAPCTPGFKKPIIQHIPILRRTFLVGRTYNRLPICMEGGRYNASHALRHVPRMMLVP